MLIVLLCLDFAAFVGSIISIFLLSDIFSIGLIILGFLFEIITYTILSKFIKSNDTSAQAVLYSDNLVDTLNKKVMEREFKIQRLEDEIRRLKENELKENN